MATLTIKDQVKNAVQSMNGGTDYTVSDVWVNVLAYSSDISQQQIKRALRDIPFVKRVAAGTYRIKGRKVPQN